MWSLFFPPPILSSSASLTHIDVVSCLSPLSFATLQMMIRVRRQSISSLCQRCPAQSKSLLWSRASIPNKGKQKNKKKQSSQRPKEDGLRAECPHRNANLSAKNLSSSPEKKSPRKKVPHHIYEYCMTPHSGLSSKHQTIWIWRVVKPLIICLVQEVQQIGIYCFSKHLFVPKDVQTLGQLFLAYDKYKYHH